MERLGVQEDDRRLAAVDASGPLLYSDIAAALVLLKAVVVHSDACGLVLVLSGVGRSSLYLFHAYLTTATTAHGAAASCVSFHKRSSTFGLDTQHSSVLANGSIQDISIHDTSETTNAYAMLSSTTLAHV
ncbi:unnamed protein product [Gongylonema pulchrum]|uniref:Kinesin motor domain-containing protein n=1 Tax=Gongylonema pulchrum TaxID=637853 RepID=A0A183EHK0_9BILA|nr:unnamed protein product [Gongylonema pulchrum]